MTERGCIKLNIYNKFSFIVGFMVFIVFYNMIFGGKATQYLLILILLGMVITNTDKFTALVTKASDTKGFENGIMNTPQTGNGGIQYT